MLKVLRHIPFQERRLAAAEEATTWEDAFSALVARQSRFVFRVAYSILRNAQDSEDVVQETFLKIFRLKRGEGMDNEKAFLARTASRIALDRLRSRPVGAVGLDTPSNSETPEQAVIAADWSATVHRLIDALPEELRLPLALSTVEELKSHEISVVLGIPEGTVRTRLMRARQTLKQKLSALTGGAYAE